MESAITIQQAIDTILNAVSALPYRQTVDTIKAGDASQSVKGIVTTFLATQEVIHGATTVGANLIITHEEIFYSNRDDMNWLENDQVSMAKTQLIQQHELFL